MPSRMLFILTSCDCQFEPANGCKQLQCYELNGLVNIHEAGDSRCSFVRRVRVVDKTRAVRGDTSCTFARADRGDTSCTFARAVRGDTSCTFARVSGRILEL